MCFHCKVQCTQAFLKGIFRSAPLDSVSLLRKFRVALGAENHDSINTKKSKF